MTLTHCPHCRKSLPPVRVDPRRWQLMLDIMARDGFVSRYSLAQAFRIGLTTAREWIYRQECAGRFIYRTDANGKRILGEFVLANPADWK